MKHLRKWKLLYFFIGCFILGFATMSLFHSGYFGKLFNSFGSLKWYYHILMFIFVYFLTLVLHELTHFISFLFSGYKNEVIIILFLVFYKKENRWKLKIDFKLLLLGGGLVFPNFGLIETESDFNKAKKAMKSSLLAAPLFTLISGTLLFIITLIFFFKNKILVPFSFYTFLISMFYTYLSSKETDTIKGDFKAYKHVKTDENFAVITVLQYAESIPHYLIDLMKEHLKDQKPIKRDLISLGFFAVLLDQAVYYNEHIDYFILKKVYDYYLNPPAFNTLLRNPDHIDVAQAVLFYLERLNYKKEVKILFDLFSLNIQTNTYPEKSQNYLLKQTSHILKLSDETEFLADINNFNKGFLSFLYKNIPPIMESEQYKNKGYSKIVLHSLKTSD